MHVHHQMASVYSVVFQHILAVNSLKYMSLNCIPHEINITIHVLLEILQIECLGNSRRY